MQWGNQNILLGLFGLIPLGVFFMWYFRRKERLLHTFASEETAPHLVDTGIRKRQKRKAFLLLVTIGLLIIVLARPQYGTIERPVVQKGVDIYVALDTSISMYAADMDTNRLERAKDILRSLLYRLRGDRVGLIIFAGDAFIQCPLTVDYDIALNTLESVEVGVVPVQGTAIGKAIRKAMNSFKRTPRGYRTLVLITDGEDQGTEPIAAAREAAEEGIVIYTIGIGSPDGAPIPLPDGGFKEDSEGHKVMSKLDFMTLRKIASETGGKAVLAQSSGDAEATAIYNDIQDIHERELESKVRTIYEDRFQYVLLPAIVLLLVATFLPERRRKNIDIPAVDV